MKKTILLTLFIALSLPLIFAQNSTIAKLKFESAEENYSDAKYELCIQKLYEAEKLFGTTNPPISHLKVLVYDKLVKSLLVTEDRDMEYIVLLGKECDSYMNKFSSINGTEEKTREVFKIQEEYEAGIKALNNNARIGVIVTSAYSGDAEAAYELGQLYQKDKKRESALIWYLKAAEKGNLDAMVEVYESKIYLKHMKGYNQKSADSLAFYYLTTASDKSNVRAMYVLGNRFSQNKNGAEGRTAVMGRDLLLVAAEKGESDAYYSLGRLHQEGSQTIKKDDKVAMAYFFKGAEMGAVNSLRAVAKIYEKGTPQDFIKVMECYQKILAKDPLDVNAYFSIGALYHLGKGVEKNNKKAIEFYEKALAANPDYEIEFANYVGEVYYEGGYGVIQDYSKAFKYFKQGSLEYTSSQWYLGQMYEKGLGVSVDYGAAMIWYKKATEYDFYTEMKPEALHSIGELYEKGLGVKKDKTIAQEWYSKALAAEVKSN